MIPTPVAPADPVSQLALTPSAEAEPYFSAWARRLDWPCLIVRIPDLHVLWRNGEAITLLTTGQDVGLRDGALNFRDQRQHRRFRATIDQLTGGSLAWCCPRRGRDDHYIVKLDFLDMEALPAGAGLMFHTTSGEDRFLWADIGEIFGLTNAEVVVVKKLASGERADSIADGLGVSLDTVRTHIRSIYAKLNVGSREELFSVVTPFRLG